MGGTDHVAPCCACTTSGKTKAKKASAAGLNRMTRFIRNRVLHKGGWWRTSVVESECHKRKKTFSRKRTKNWLITTDPWILRLPKTATVSGCEIINFISTTVTYSLSMDRCQWLSVSWIICHRLWYYDNWLADTCTDDDECPNEFPLCHRYPTSS